MRRSTEVPAKAIQRRLLADTPEPVPCDCNRPPNTARLGITQQQWHHAGPQARPSSCSAASDSLSEHRNSHALPAAWPPPPRLRMPLSPKPTTMRISRRHPQSPSFKTMCLCLLPIPSNPRPLPGHSGQCGTLSSAPHNAPFTTFPPSNPPLLQHTQARTFRCLCEKICSTAQSSTRVT